MKKNRLGGVTWLTQSCTANQRQSLDSGQYVVQLPQGQGEQIPHGQELPSKNGMVQPLTTFSRHCLGQSDSLFFSFPPQICNNVSLFPKTIKLLFIKQTPRQVIEGKQLVNFVQNPVTPPPEPAPQ